MSDRLVRTGLLLPAAAVWVVALVATARPGLALPGAGVVAAVAVVLLVQARRRRTRAAVLAAATALAVTALLLAVAAGDVRRHPAVVRAGEPAVVDLRVDQVLPVTGFSTARGSASREVLRGTLVAVDGRAVAVPVTLFGDRSGAVPGTLLRLRVVLRAAAPTDAAAYLGSARAAEVVAPPPLEQRAADALRAGLLQRTAELHGDGAALLPGLAVGDTSRVDPGLEQAMRDSSLTHLTAVSGANCAVVVIGVLAVAARLRLRRAVRIVLAGLALAGFVVLVTPQPSVVRASVMAAVGLACVLRGGRAAGVPALALTVLVLVLADPWTAWSAGFVLSVAATAGLLLLAPPLAERLSRVLPPGLALVIAVPLAAQAACQPVLALLQPGIPVFGVVANLLAEPAAPVATVLGLIACLLGPVAPPLATGVAALAWLPSAWIGLVARVVAGLPQLGWPAGAAGAALALLVLAAGVAALLRAAPRVRRAGIAALAATSLVVTGVAAGGAVGRLVGTPADWTFAACDVGQGDGLVLNGGGGRFAVVDTGREPELLRACLTRLGVGRIELLVLTHWDADHVGAADALAGRVASAFVGPSDGPAADALRGRLARSGAAVQQVHRGQTAALGRLRLAVLWPPVPLGGTAPGNAASITLHVTGGGGSLLLTGDLGEEAQDALLAAGPVPRADVVKVAHHGSADQSPALYERLRARLGVVSVGADNDYGHPTARALRMLRAAGTGVVRTDQDGLVLVGWRDGRLRVWTERPATAAAWTPAK